MEKVLERPGHSAAVENPKREASTTAPPLPAQVRKAIEYLTKHPGEIPPEFRIRLLQHLVTMDANQAWLLLASQLREYERLYPAESMVVDMTVEGWAQARGKRIIDDDKIQAAIQEQMAAKKVGVIKRFLQSILLNEREQKTALLRENIDLAAHSESLKLKNKQLHAENQELEKNIRETLETTAKEARVTVESANKTAADTMKAMKAEQSAIEADIAELKEAKAKLRKDPKVVQLVEQSQHEFQSMHWNIMEAVDSILLSATTENSSVNVSTRYKTLYETIVLALKRLEDRFGVAKRHHTAAQIALRLRPGATWHLSYSGCCNGKKPWEVSKVIGLFTFLASEKCKLTFADLDEIFKECFIAKEHGCCATMKLTQEGWKKIQKKSK